jgi:hypothetical protein
MKDINEQIAEIEGLMNDPNLCFGTASTYSRVTGYFRPVENFCHGKRQEYMERNEYNPWGTKGDINKQWVKKILHEAE